MLANPRGDGDVGVAAHKKPEAGINDSTKEGPQVDGGEAPPSLHPTGPTAYSQTPHDEATSHSTPSPGHSGDNAIRPVQIKESRLVEDLQARRSHLERQLSTSQPTKTQSTSSPPAERSSSRAQNHLSLIHFPHTAQPAHLSLSKPEAYSPYLPFHTAPLPHSSPNDQNGEDHSARPRGYRELFSFPRSPLARRPDWPESWPVFWEGADPSGIEVQPRAKWAKADVGGSAD